MMCAGCAVAMMVLPSCDDSKSFSELLKDEEYATNWYMANERIELEIPEDSVFQVGEEAPYYKMDDEGYLYMKVLNAGEKDNRPAKGDMVYFRFMRRNIKSMFDGLNPSWEGNANDMNNVLGNTSLIYGNMQVEGTALYGTGIQVPLNYLGYNSEVMLVVRSYQGFTTDQSQCIPYVYNVKYYKAEY